MLIPMALRKPVLVPTPQRSQAGIGWGWGGWGSLTWGNSKGLVDSGQRLGKVRALGWEPREGKRKADSPHLSQPASTFSSGVHWAQVKPRPSLCLGTCISFLWLHTNPHKLSGLKQEKCRGAWVAQLSVQLSTQVMISWFMRSSPAPRRALC